MKCSNCGNTSYVDTGGYKVNIEKLGIKIEPDVYRPRYYVESEPYLILCPECFKKIFQGQQFKKDVTSTETREVACDI